jgi:hypothetical protein
MPGHLLANNVTLKTAEAVPGAHPEVHSENIFRPFSGRSAAINPQFQFKP